jgi:exosortase
MAALACFWLWLWFHLSAEWAANEQYQYGFAVPFLFLYLFLEKWRGGFEERGATWKSAAFLAFGWGLFLFAELLRQQDPIWRLTGASMMLAVTVMTLTWLYRCGCLALVRAEAFPLAFAWLALPWPVPVELYLTQNMLAVLTAGTVVLLNWTGVAALQHGNAIELTRGIVGIDTACSGIQSLQASLMAGLFLGAFYRLNCARRAWLMGLAWATAMSANFIRVFFLAFMVHLHGEGAVALYHDKAGYLASFATFLLILLLASRLDHSANRLTDGNAGRASVALSGKDGVALLAGVLCIPLAAWAWFTAVGGENLKTVAAPRWTLHLNGLPEGWQTETWEPSSHEYSMLRYSAREALSIRTPSGLTAHVVHFFWKPGKSMPGLAFYHTPQMCMPWVGWRETDVPRPVTLAVQGVPLPCVAYRFRMEEARQVVYQTLCAGGRTSAFMLDPAAMAGRGKRLSMLWRAPREQVNEELLVYLPGDENSDEKTEPQLAGEILGRVLSRSGATP